MRRDLTPRPNVASGAVMGFVVLALGLLLAALQSHPTGLEAWLVALQPLVAAAVAFGFPAYSKAWGAAVGAGLISLIVLITNIAQGTVVFDTVLVMTLVVGIVQAAVTGLVANNFPKQPTDRR